MFAEDDGLMRVENFTEGNEAVVRVEMAGIDPDKDVEISVTDHTLRVHAERREETKTEDKGSYRSEFRYGSFTRVVPFPAGATEKDVKATYKDGILEIRVPVDRASRRRPRSPSNASDIEEASGEGDCAHPGYHPLRLRGTRGRHRTRPFEDRSDGDKGSVGATEHSRLGRAKPSRRVRPYGISTRYPPGAVQLFNEPLVMHAGASEPGKKMHSTPSSHRTR